MGYMLHLAHKYKVGFIVYVTHTSMVGYIEATGEFVINYAPFSLKEKVVETGLMFSEGINELEKAGLTAIPALTVKPPRIEECFQRPFRKRK